MRKTQKFRYAARLYYQLKLTEKFNNQEQLYSLLISNNYYWNSQEKIWEKGGIPEPPSELVKIRITCDRDRLDSVVKNMSIKGLYLLEISDPFPCRPPRQNDIRVYLSFKPLSQIFPLSSDAVLGNQL